MGDFLPISMFFYEIWVKNRPFLQLFTKQYNLSSDKNTYWQQLPKNRLNYRYNWRKIHFLTHIPPIIRLYLAENAFLNPFSAKYSKSNALDLN